MSKQDVVIVTCDGGGAHATKVATVSAYVKAQGKYWVEIQPERVRALQEQGKSTGVPALDALRHVTSGANQEVMKSHGVPWNTNLDLMLSDVEEGMRHRNRGRFDCTLCRKRRTPNSLVIARDLGKVLDGAIAIGQSIITIDTLRTITKHFGQ